MEPLSKQNLLHCALPSCSLLSSFCEVFWKLEEACLVWDSRGGEGKPSLPPHPIPAETQCDKHSLSLPWKRAWVKPASQQGCMFSGVSAEKHKAEKTAMADTVKSSTPIKLWCLCHTCLESQHYYHIRKEIMSTGITEFLTQ